MTAPAPLPLLPATGKRADPSLTSSSTQSCLVVGGEGDPEVNRGVAQWASERAAWGPKIRRAVPVLHLQQHWECAPCTSPGDRCESRP